MVYSVFERETESHRPKSQKNPLISTSQIDKKLLGNEEKEKIPGFYNLIHINANNDSHNRPLDSKYILDNYVYETAILYDHRQFWRIYFICILSKENIINTFFFKSPLEIQSIRLCLFLFNFVKYFYFKIIYIKL